MAEKKETNKKENENLKDKDAASLNPTLQKKKERREAKAARKAANMREEKKSRPSNLLLAVLIFGVLLAMFIFIGGYNYFSKPATIEAYLEESGMGELYNNLQMDEHTTATVTSKGNDVTIDMKATADADEEIEHIKEHYTGDEGKENLEDIAASILLSMKPETRAFGANAECKVTLNDEEINSIKITYSDAKRIQKEAAKEAEEDSGDDVDVVDTDSDEGSD